MMQDCGLSIRVFKLHSIKDSFDLRPNGEKLRDGGRKKAVIPCTVRNLAEVNIAKLPSVPRQILKDIPRPPNSASRDD
jgi:hypothetical protein